MKVVLAIESSCDETAAAVVCGCEVRSSIVASQVAAHERFGGVVPEVASRQHLEAIDDVIARALEHADLDPVKPAVDAIAVTRGPGLIGALLVGIAAASSRAWAWSTPLYAVDHLMGHVASVLLADPTLTPPMLCLLVSGGHTMLLDVDAGWRVTLLGSTRDDAAGEAFDKAARLLGLGMPGGPNVSELATQGNALSHTFTPAMVHHASLDTSFAGLKTALALALQHDTASDADLAASFELAAIETLAAMVRKGLDQYGPGTSSDRRTLGIVGGVAANRLLRDRLHEMCRKYDVHMVHAPLEYCGDNAAMIGIAAGLDSPMILQHPADVEAYASSPLFRTGQLLPTGDLT